ncbi:chemotaxis protein CheD [Desulfonema ishimotonii]|uniref:Probable chemoreceptor glutamine deamidase CheD n=1 Tax=Desulfonema ishimotonii TaxID=45657 RepID=A0A401FVA0_9BACT|nr:chemotaxis protein CheD [Desulfonema ishimotonii]GBC60896.1 chemotaxis protein CheD [Desulfonema ishimotonii]
MNQPDARLPMIFLRPSELFIRRDNARQPLKVTTVLGSCVSLTLFNARLGMAAICHALLPRCGPDRSDCQGSFRYVQSVIPLMFSDFQRRGGRPGETEVKLFGGSDMFGRNSGAGGIPSVGSQNVEMAVEMIGASRFHLKTADVRGRYGRKISFYPHTGDVWVKPLGGRGRGEQADIWKKS